MTPKERVSRAVHRQGPDRLPVRLAFNQPESDVIGTGICAPLGWQAPGPHVDEWGCEWDTLGDTIVSSLGQVRGHPLADWDRFATYRLPDARDPSRFRAIPDTVARWPDRYIVASVGITGFNRITFLRGMENFLMDLLEAPARARQLIAAVCGWELAVIQELARCPGVDAIGFADDWGTQQALLIGRRQWDEFFRPWYASQFAAIKAGGKDVFFHSCGMVKDIIGPLIELGADALNLNQPRLLGIEYLARHHGGKVCFLCPVDMQRTIITGTPEAIAAEAEYLVQQLGCFNGGFIPCADEGIDHGYVPRANIAAMTAAFRRLSGQ